MSRLASSVAPAPIAAARVVSLAALLVVGALALYWRTAWSMLDTWLRSDTFAHGLVVVPIALWLGWQQRARFDAVAIRPFAPALIALLGAGALWLVSQLAVVNTGRQFALVFMIQAALVTLLGWRFARVFAFPLAFLLFAVPFGEFMLPTLMEWTADFTVASLRLTGVPVYREGMDFVIPSGSWSVVEECSGVRYLIASFMGGTLFAHLAYRSTVRRLAFMALALAVPIVANWVRAYLIVMLGHLSDNKLAAGVDHLIYGWLFFGVVVFLLFWAGARWRESPGATVRQGARDSRSNPDRAPGSVTPGRFTAVWLTALAAIGTWAALAYYLEPGVDASKVEVLPISARQGWGETPVPIAGWTPQYAGYRGALAQTFEKDGRLISVHLAYYRAQDESHSLISSTNALAASANREWRVSAQGRTALPWQADERVFRRTELAGAAERLLVADVYWIDGRLTASDQLAKLLLAMAKLQGRGDDAALIAIAIQRQDGDRDESHLRRFLLDMSPAIDAALSATRTAARSTK